LLESNDRRKRVKVYLAIATVAANLAKEGISKARTNQSQGYKFRGIDDVYNSLAPFLAEAKLCILPNVLSREVVERVNAKSTALFYVTVRVQFDFVSAEDGSKHSVVTYGEAMDSGDKATNKAMSAAYKYAAMQAFCIPTEGDNDADATTHEVKAVEPDAEGAGYLTGAQSLDELADIWRSLTPKQRATLGPTKDAMKKRLMDAEAATQL
jgi:hypothetical protein